MTNCWQAGNCLLLLAQEAIISYCWRGGRTKSHKTDKGVETERERERRREKKNNRRWKETIKCDWLQKVATVTRRARQERSTSIPLCTARVHMTLSIAASHTRTHPHSHTTGRLKGIPRQVTWQRRGIRKRPWQWMTNQRSAEQREQSCSPSEPETPGHWTECDSNGHRAGLCTPHDDGLMLHEGLPRETPAPHKNITTRPLNAALALKRSTTPSGFMVVCVVTSLCGCPHSLWHKERL